jgi:hypothetical protein
MEEIKQSAELTEAQLDGVAGGATQNRWNPDECRKYGRTAYNCVGFLAGCWCDYYSKDFLRYGHISSTQRHTLKEVYRHKCAMGAFNYEGDGGGTPC